jgi:single-strand DNA-binding protein
MYEGYLGADPDMRFTPAGKAVCDFRIGSSRSYKKGSGEKVEETTWVKVTAWGSLAEIINDYCAKGSHVIVTGALKPGERGSPNVFQLKNGDYAASYEITAREVRIIKGRPMDGAAGEVEDEESLPFD